MGAPADVMREFERTSPGKSDHQSPEILDLESLMALDELSEDNAGLFIDERDLKRREYKNKKEQQAGLCKRCRSLRFDNKPIDEK